MIDIQYIREHPAAVQLNAQQRNITVDIRRLLELDEQLRAHTRELDELRQQRNSNAAGLQILPDKTSAEARTAISQGKKLKQLIAGVEGEIAAIQADYEPLVLAVPNLCHPAVPVGPDESANVVLRQVGEPTTFNFAAQPHWELGVTLDVLDNERATKVSGARFTYLKRAAALLEFALIQHVLATLTTQATLQDIAKKAGLGVDPRPFIPIVPPVCITPQAFSKMGRLEPRAERYHIQQDDLYLIGSAEHTIGAMHMDETFAEKDLPLRYIGFSTAFRREAGSYGKDTKGILRMHQFDKLEMETFTTAQQGEAEQLFLVAIQEYLLASLGLPYRVVLNASGDMGAPDYRQMDIETWLPGQDSYRETHSSDYMTDYQARRLHIKVKRGNGRSEFVHMNDATAYAIGRTIIAIMENYQQADGSIVVPAALEPYMHGHTRIVPPAIHQ